jgi:hypothetical protein
MNARTKYPRTPHLPWSQGRTSDDKVLKSIDPLQGRQVVVTEKMDGENTTLYRDGFHARSIDSRHHVSRDWLAKFHASIAHDIPIGWRVCGENLYARHSIAYQALPSYFMGFSIWDEANTCLSWADTEEWLACLGIEPAPVLWRGVFDEDQVRYLVHRLDSSSQEGYVVRVANAFSYKDFGQSVAKFVRENHVQTDTHWMHQSVVPNQLQNQEARNVQEALYQCGFEVSISDAAAVWEDYSDSLGIRVSWMAGAETVESAKRILEVHCLSMDEEAP